MIDKERIKTAKELLKVLKKTGQKRGIFNNVFSLLREDIFKLKEKGLSNRAIAKLLSEELKDEIKERTLTSWIYNQKKEKKGGKNATTAITQTDNENDNEKKDSNPFAFLKN